VQLNLAVTAPDQSLKTSGRGYVAAPTAGPAGSAVANNTPPGIAVTLSDEAQNLLLKEQQAGASGVSNPPQSTPAVAAGASLDSEQQQIIRELARRDIEVRNHERIHASVGGRYTSAPSYTYERGPDGRLYAVSGEVRIDTTPVPNNPEATLEKALTIQRAALAVPDPSPADRSAAAQARMMAAEARAEISAADRAEATANRPVGNDEAHPVVQQAKDDERVAGAEKDQSTQFELNSARMAEISQQLAELNRKLFNAGVVEQLNPAGSLVNLIV